MKNRDFQPGFRISITDGLVVVIGAVAAIGLYPTSPDISFAIALPVGHFFLFCNTFRIARKPELVWAGIFLVLAYLTIEAGALTWPVTTGLSLLVASFLILLETRKPSYHGVLWRKLNPTLQEWLEQHSEEDND
jgi:hypothetical protein